MTSRGYQVVNDPKQSTAHSINLLAGNDEHPPHQGAPKEHMNRPRWRTALSLLLAHGLPGAVSCLLIALNAAELRWRSSMAGGTSEILSVLQVASKAQELLAIFSISQIVLFWLINWLAKGDGMPFGLFVGALSLTVGASPFSKGVWTSLALSLTKTRLLRVCLLVIGATFLGLVLGPATAVMLLPRLDWWPDHNIFQIYSFSTRWFEPLQDSMYIPKNIFPTRLLEDALLGDYCSDPSLDRNGSCPYAGFKYLSPMFSDARDVNATIDSAELSLGRRMIRTDGFGGLQYTCASIWTSPRLINDYMSLNYYDGHSGVSSIEASIRTSAPLIPIVDVICGNSTPATEYKRSLAFMANFLSNANPSFSGSSFGEDIAWQLDLRDTWNETILNNSSDYQLKWRDDVWPNRNVLLGLVLSPGEGAATPNVTVCAINAKYVPAKLWYTSTQNVISSNFTWTLQLNPGGYLGYGDQVGKVLPYKQITIDKSWADVLNANGVLAQLIAGAMADTNHSSYDTDTTNAATGKSNLAIPHRQMAALGAGVLDGIARVGIEHSIAASFSGSSTWSNKTVLVCNKDKWCSQGPLIAGSESYILNSTHDEFMAQNPDWISDSVPSGYADGRNDTPVMRSFAMPVDADEKWTQIAFPVKRYTYGWGFNSTMVKLAAAVLAWYIFVTMVHCSLALFLRESEVGVGLKGLGDILALAWGSRPPIPPKDQAERSSSSISSTVLGKGRTRKNGWLRTVRTFEAGPLGQGSKIVGWQRGVGLRARWNAVNAGLDDDDDGRQVAEVDMVVMPA
ncbi:hypothetical protein LTS15_001191 [Exophiala xenobiotica]|nr:hypothetical protein LTS15_001191 [Exophiala xenobiotica]